LRAATNPPQHKETRVSAGIPLIQSQRKLDGLHGLRAVAALAVVLFHLQVMPGLPRPSWFVTFAGLFYLSVHLFFVISAFSLYHSSRYAPARYPAYLVKRFFRIAPLYYVMLGYVVWRVGFPGWGALLANLTFTFNLFPGLEVGIVFAGWSVGVEMIFYLLLPGLLFVLRSRVAFALLFVAATLSSMVLWRVTAGSASLREDFAYYSLLGNLPAFAAGLFAYRTFMAMDARPRRAGANAGLAAAFVVLLALAVIDPLELHWRSSGLYFAVWALPFATLCLWQALYPSRLMRSAAAQWLADRSFSIYLLHPIVLVVFQRGYQLLLKWGVPDGIWLYPVCLVGALSGLLLAAEVTYRCVELPGIGFGRRIAARIDAAGKMLDPPPSSLEPGR
jgi:peptidoglycan/LPS O-acetylase OafA/YrhL